MNWGCDGSALDLSPQPQHLNVDRAIINFVVVHPARLQELVPRENPLRGGEQRGEQIELAVRQRDGIAVALFEAPRAQIELELGETVGANLPLARRLLSRRSSSAAIPFVSAPAAPEG